jgi:hypothetical protein
MQISIIIFLKTNVGVQSIIYNLEYIYGSHNQVDLEKIGECIVQWFK